MVEVWVVGAAIRQHWEAAQEQSETEGLSHGDGPEEYCGGGEMSAEMRSPNQQDC